MFSYTKHHINNEMNIYFINIMDNTPEKNFIFWAEIVSFEKRLKVNKFRFLCQKTFSIW